MRRSHKIALVPLLLFSPFSMSSATSESNIGPIAKVDELSIETMRGDSLGRFSDRGTPVFGVDFPRVARLESRIRDVASERLEAGDVRVVDKSDNVIVFKLFGGTFRSVQSHSSVYFMLQVDVCLPESPRCSEERAILGVVEDEKVEEAVLESVTEVTDDFVQARRAYRNRSNGR